MNSAFHACPMHAKTLGVILLTSLIGCTTTYEVAPDQLPGSRSTLAAQQREGSRGAARAVTARDGSTARLDAYTMARFHLRDGTRSPWVRASEVSVGARTIAARVPLELEQIDALAALAPSEAAIDAMRQLTARAGARATLAKVDETTWTISLEEPASVWINRLRSQLAHQETGVVLEDICAGTYINGELDTRCALQLLSSGERCWNVAKAPALIIAQQARARASMESAMASSRASSRGYPTTTSAPAPPPSPWRCTDPPLSSPHGRWTMMSLGRGLVAADRPLEVLLSWQSLYHGGELVLTRDAIAHVELRQVDGLKTYPLLVVTAGLAGFGLPFVSVWPPSDDDARPLNLTPEALLGREGADFVPDPWVSDWGTVDLHLSVGGGSGLSAPTRPALVSTQLSVIAWQALELGVGVALLNLDGMDESRTTVFGRLAWHVDLDAKRRFGLLLGGDLGGRYWRGLWGARWNIHGPWQLTLHPMNLVGAGFSGEAAWDLTSTLDLSLRF